MVNLYVKNIMAGKYKFERVPDRWKNEVKAVFDKKLADNLITQEEYDRYLNSTNAMM